MMVEIFLVGFYLMAVGILTYLGYQRQVGGTKVFFLSLFLTPIAGMIILNVSPVLIQYREQRYKCSRCGFEYNEKHPECPFCAEDGVKVPLKTIYKTMT